LHNTVFRFEHIEISGGAKRGLEVGINASVTLGPGAVVRNNQGGGVVVSSIKDEYRDQFSSGALILDGGIVENNRSVSLGGGIYVLGAFTMKRGSIRNNTVALDANGISSGGGICVNGSEPVSIEGGEITGNTADVGGGIVIIEGRVTMSGGSVSGNTATGVVGGVAALRGGVFTQRGGTVSGNRAPANTRADSHNVFRMDGSSSVSSSGGSSPPRSFVDSSSNGASSSSSPSGGSSSSSRSSEGVGFTYHASTYFHVWHQNLLSFGIPLQLGVELEMPVITLDVLGEASAGIGYGNLLEYHLGGMAELYFSKKSIGLGVGMGLYGNAINWGFDLFGSGRSTVNYASPVKTNYYRFALIFRGISKISLYAEMYGNDKWGFGLMFGSVLID
jgi:hypothetical protein